MALLNLASFVLILPGCGLACVVLGFYVLTTIPLGTVLWNLFVALAWLPVVVAAFVGVVLALIRCCQLGGLDRLMAACRA